MPTSFTTDSPARVSIDLLGVENGLTARSQMVGAGAVHSVVAIEAGGRTRVVVNMVESVPYEMRVDGNQVILILQSGRAGMAESDSSSIVKVQEGNPAEKNRVETIDFRRGADGEGRVLIRLSDSAIVTDVREEGEKILIEFIGATISDEQVRSLDVTDFATPVVGIKAQPNGANVAIEIATTGSYEYLAYQADKLYSVELRPLSKEEKAELQKERLIYSGDRLSLNFQDIEVRAVLQLLADFTSLNLVASDTVDGRITLRLKNVPWDQALDIILKSKGLSMRRNDNVIMVAPTEEIAAREKLELESRQQIEELAPVRSEFIQINYAKAADMASLLKSEENRLLSVRGNVTVDPRTNMLLIQDTAAKLEEVRRLIKRLDIPVRQVLIESRIVIANNDFAKDLGVRFGFSNSSSVGGGSDLLIGGGMPGHLGGTQTLDSGSFMGVQSGIENPGGSGNRALMVNLPTAAPSGAANLLLGRMGAYLLNLELSAMQTEGRGEVVSSPRVITSDQTKATIKQGMEIPYQEASSSGATTVSFKEAVLKLEVTPHITPDDRIRMDLLIKKDNPDFGNAVLGVPPLETRKIETTVLVDNGETVVLGGVFERTKTKSREQIPFFGDIPFIGVLFRKSSDRDENSELLIFVTPKILKEALGVR
ncbi:MAG: type IV pilus secretin PilQ [Candidatus Polarisedimenticolaceae bacterium]|nr:type IV pilus secretin PilQ [Candidatus Polarisedimenticolaceae bacterium]